MPEGMMNTMQVNREINLSALGDTKGVNEMAKTLSAGGKILVRYSASNHAIAKSWFNDFKTSSPNVKATFRESGATSSSSSTVASFGKPAASTKKGSAPVKSGNVKPSPPSKPEQPSSTGPVVPVMTSALAVSAYLGALRIKDRSFAYTILDSFKFKDIFIKAWRLFCISHGYDDESAAADYEVAIRYFDAKELIYQEASDKAAVRFKEQKEKKKKFAKADKKGKNEALPDSTINVPLVTLTPDDDAILQLIVDELDETPEGKKKKRKEKEEAKEDSEEAEDDEDDI